MAGSRQSETAQSRSIEHWKLDVRSDRFGQKQSVGLAVLTDHHQPGPDGFVGVPKRLAGWFIGDLEGSARGAIGAEDRAEQFGSTGADEPCDSEDFSGAKRERYVLDLGAEPELLDSQGLS